MNNIPRQQLHALITQQGHAVCYDPNQCESRLRELCPEHPREINLLISALKENVMAELLAVSEDTPKDAVLSKLAQRLYNNLGMAPEEAHWAVESWALALGVIETASFTTSQADTTAKPSHSKITAADREWWNRLDYEWKGFFKKTFKIQGEPNDAQLAKQVHLQELSCSNSQISRLEPLSHLTDLQVLTCSHNKIVSLGPLQNLTQLRILDCAFNNISSLEPLQHLKNLQKLVCYDNKISNLGPLQHLTQLQTLYCGNTQVNRLEPLRELTNLQELYCSETQISSLEPLRELRNLQELGCSETQISSLEPLRELTKLQGLYCSETQISSLEPLRELTKLEWLGCSLNQISSLEPLRELTNLQKLYCSMNQISSLEPLRELTNLQELDCDWNTQISSLEPLRELTNLQELDIRETNISSLEPLYNLTKLRSLSWYIDQLSFEEIDRFVRECPQCDIAVTPADIKWWLQLDEEWQAIFKKAIDIEHEPDNSELVDIVQLQELNCQKTQTSSLEPLRQLKNLEELNCRGTQINSLEPLHDLNNLRKLDCNDTKVSRREIKQFQKAVPQCHVKCYEFWLDLLYIFLVFLILVGFFWIFEFIHLLLR